MTPCKRSGKQSRLAQPWIATITQGRSSSSITIMTTRQPPPSPQRRELRCWFLTNLLPIILILLSPTRAKMSSSPLASLRPSNKSQSSHIRSSVRRTTSSTHVSTATPSLSQPYYQPTTSSTSTSLPSIPPTRWRRKSTINQFSENLHASLQAAHDKVESWRQQLTQQLRRHVPPEALAVLAGTASFGCTLAMSTTLQQRLLGMSTGTPAPLPSLVGAASVCVASTTAHQVALATHAFADTGEWPENFTLWPRADQSAYFFYQDQILDLKVIQLPMHSVRIWAAGLVCFKLLGGRFWAVSPSSVTHVGSYARASLPATANYATAQQRLQIERLGRLWGCHTCGSHRWFTFPRISINGGVGVPGAQFVGDHMPPKSVAQQLETSLWYRCLRRKVRYRFYPQCIKCSNKQGSLLSKASAALQNRRGSSAARRLAAVGGGRVASYNHGWQPRFAHLTGGLVAATAVINTHPADLADENRWRYAQWQSDLVDLVYRKEQQVQLEIEKIETRLRKRKESR